MGLTHEELKSMLAPYAIGAVTHDEMRVLRSHILTCEECMEEADQLTDAASLMTYAADEAPLPAGFADRIMEVVEAERPAAARRVGAPRRWRVLVASGTAVLALLATGVLALDARRDRDRTHDALLAVLGSDRGFELTGEGGITARLVPTTGGSLFVAAGLETAPDAHTYQLWFIRDGEPVSGGTFDVDGDIAVLETPDRLGGVEGAAVTVEPEGGSQAPTSDPFITT